MKHIKLKKADLTKEDIDKLMSYASVMDYVLDLEPEEFNGEYVILRDASRSKKVFIQKKNNQIFGVYGTRTENISFIMDVLFYLINGSKSLLKKSNFKFIFEIQLF